MLRPAGGVLLELGGRGHERQGRLVALEMTASIKGIELTRISEVAVVGSILLCLRHSLGKLIEAQSPLLLSKFSEANCVIRWRRVLEAHVAFCASSI